MKILVADDHTLFRKSFMGLLRSLPLVDSVIGASNGKEALDLTLRERPDIVCLDIRMPVMDGFETCECLTRDFSKVKVMIVTQYDSSVVVLHFMKLGAYAYITKAAEPEEVELALKTLASGKKYFNRQMLEMVNDSVSSKESQAVLKLTGQEKKIIRLLQTGLTSKELAEEVNLSAKTVNSYRERLLEKTKSKNVAELISFAYKTGWLD